MTSLGIPEPVPIRDEGSRMPIGKEWEALEGRLDLTLVT
jgi:hypothetical protein